jgi:DNA-binding CsgD family transcriptional regulator
VKARRTSLVGGGQRDRLPASLLRLCGARLDSLTFRRRLRAELSRTVPFTAYCVNTVDPESLVVTSSVGDGLPTDAARRLFELEERGDDVNQLAALARGPVHVASIGQATSGSPTRSARMRELFLPRGWHDELRAALVVGGACWGYLHLFRSLSQAAFNAEDVALLEAARPALAAALRTACVLGGGSRIASAPGVLLLDERGSVAQRSAVTRDWLAAFAGDVGGETPHVLHALAARLVQGAPSVDVSARYRSPSAGWLGLHGGRLSSGAALVLGAAHAEELAPVLLLAHCLTTRERDVALLILKGLSSASIATALGIGVHTVKDHVKAILRKTGAPSRTQLIARLAG